MIVQLDESVPARVATALARHGCRALRFPNDWKGLKNGELLVRLRSSGVDCLVTCDKNIQHQQSIARSGIALIVLPRQRFADLGHLLPSIAQVAASANPGQTISIGFDGTVGVTDN